MCSESARGHKGIFNELADWIEYSDSPRPMNINKYLWSGLIGEKPAALYDPRKNVEAATILVKRIRDRTANPTPAKNGSIWIFTGREKVNESGAYRTAERRVGKG